jgi:hypothetical protein
MYAYVHVSVAYVHVCVCSIHTYMSSVHQAPDLHTPPLRSAPDSLATGT